MFCFYDDVFVEQLLPAALQVASEEDAEFRQGLPLDYMSYMGLVHSDKVSTNALPSDARST